MAVREYIGARYVPKFDGTHNINKAYEPLTIVTDIGETTSYTSKKSVPVGVPLNNTEYWAITGTLNGALVDLQDRMGVVENETDKLLKESELNLKGRKFLIVGDSYGVPNNSWVKYFVDTLGLSSEQYNNLCVSGTGFDTNDSNGFLTQLVNYSGEKSAITDIIVGGGINDANNRNASNYRNLVNAIGEFINYAKTNYPNAKVYIGFIGGCHYASPYYNTRKPSNISWALSAYANRCQEFGGVYLSGAQYSIHTNILNYGSDGLHPSNYGDKAIGVGMTQAYLKANDCNYPLYNAVLNVTSDFTKTSGGLSYEVHNDYTTIVLDKLVLHDVDINTTHNGNSVFSVCTLDGLYFNESVAIPIRLLMGGYNGIKFQTADAELIFISNSIQIKLIQINSSGTGYENYTAGVSDYGMIAMLIDKLGFNVPTISIN